MFNKCKGVQLIFFYFFKKAGGGVLGFKPRPTGSTSEHTYQIVPLRGTSRLNRTNLLQQLWKEQRWESNVQWNKHDIMVVYFCALLMLHIDLIYLACRGRSRCHISFVIQTVCYRDWTTCFSSCNTVRR